VPSVSIMGIMIGQAIADLKNAAGITYEVPLVTSLVCLRAVLGAPMKKVGIIHREFLADFLNENRHYCTQEGIEILNAALPNKSDAFKSLIKDALKLLVDRGIEALWIPNDNALLQPDIIQQVWIPAIRRNKIPVVAGVEVLVNPQLDFGTFAVLPDHVGLGNQAAGMIFDIMNNNWTVEKKKVDPPVAVYKIVNLRQAEKRFHVSGERLKSVDKRLK